MTGAEPQKSRARRIIVDACSGKEVPAAEILRIAEEFDVSAAQLHDASRELGVSKRKGDFAAGWYWSLPARTTQHTERRTCPRCSKGTIEIVTTTGGPNGVETTTPDRCDDCIAADAEQREQKREKARARLRRRIQGYGNDGVLCPATDAELRRYDAMPWREAKEFGTSILTRPASGNVEPDGALTWR